MLGRICRGDGRGARIREERLLGLTVCALELPEHIRRQEKALKRGARLLLERRVTRVLAPPRFERWRELAGLGLRPVDTRALRCALAPKWVDASLASRGIARERAVLLLEGARESPDMERVARAICPMVRNLIIDVPGGGALAGQLRRQFGLPVLPARSAKADLTLAFSPGPVLEGASFSLDGTALPGDCEALPLLCALWEAGLVKTEEITILMNCS